MDPGSESIQFKLWRRESNPNAALLCEVLCGMEWRSCTLVILISSLLLTSGLDATVARIAARDFARTPSPLALSRPVLVTGVLSDAACEAWCRGSHASCAAWTSTWRCRGTWTRTWRPSSWRSAHSPSQDRRKQPPPSQGMTTGRTGCRALSPVGFNGLRAYIATQPYWHQRGTDCCVVLRNVRDAIG